MTEIAALGLKVDGVGNVEKARDALGRFTKASQDAETSNENLGKTSGRTRDALGRFTKGVGDGTEGVKGLGDTTSKTTAEIGAMGVSAVKVGALIGAAFSVSKLVSYADTWSDMQSKVGAATGDMEGAADRMQRIVDIANASYSPLAQTAEVYSRNVATLKDLGRSAEEAADFTESLNHMLVLTATRGERAVSVQNALAKAMAVGRLQADGLETVLANGGEVAQALARELGVTVSQLRALSSEGKITGQVIADAIIKPLDSVRDRAAEMPATVGDAFVRVTNNVTEFIGALDKATGTSGAFAGVIINAADAIRNFTKDADNMAALVTAIELSATVAAASITGRLLVSIRAATAGLSAMTVAARTASAAMAFLGGPLGIALAAASAIAYFALRSDDAKTSADKLATSVGNLSTAAERAERNFAHLTAGVDKLNQKELTLRTTQVESALSKAQRDLARYERLFAKGNTSISVGLIDQTKANVELLSKELDKLKGRSSVSSGTAEGQKAIKSMQDQLALLKVSGEARARLAALQRLGEKATAEERAEVERLSVEIYRLDEAQRKAGSSAKDHSSAAAKAADAIASQISALERARDVWGMSADAVVLYDLKQQGANDTQLKYAGSLLETVNALEKQKEAEEAIQRAREKYGPDAKSAAKYVRGQVDPLSGGAFDSQTARYDAEAAAEQERYAAQLERLQEAERLRLEILGGYQAQEEQLLAEHNARMAQIEQAKNSVMLKSNASLFEGIASLAGTFAGEQSGIYKAMFAASKAFTIADATINAYGAISKAWNSAPFPANLAAVAATTPSVMGVISSIKGASPKGFQAGGYTGNGGVSDIAGVVHGKEFVFDAATTARIGVPTLEAMQSGRTPPSAAFNGSNSGNHGGDNVVVNLHNAPAGTTATARTRREDKQFVIDVMLEDASKGGQFTSTFASNYNLQRAGR